MSKLKENDPVYVMFFSNEQTPVATIIRGFSEEDLPVIVIDDKQYTVSPCYFLVHDYRIIVGSVYRNIEDYEDALRIYKNFDISESQDNKCLLVIDSLPIPNRLGRRGWESANE